MVWRMSPYERRRGGNAPPGGLRGRPGAGNARSGQRGSGHSVATTVGRQPDTELGSAGPASWRRGEANSTASGRRVRQHRSFAPWGEARPEKWRAEPRPEPDSGNPTVRDRRGASGNVASWSIISTQRARLISISTTACTIRCGGGRQPRASRLTPHGSGNASRRAYTAAVLGLAASPPTHRREHFEREVALVVAMLASTPARTQGRHRPRCRISESIFVPKLLFKMR
jgi:hypothetical protein